ncbi:MAG: ATP-binding protein [Clostridiales bacterium]|nr:ATP-binding protein [Clostridiales bacterium]
MKKGRLAYFALLYWGVSSVLAASFSWVTRIFTSDERALIYVAIAIQIILLTICIPVSSKSVSHKVKQYMNAIPLRLKVMLLVSIGVSTLLVYCISAFFVELPPAYMKTRTIALFVVTMVATAILIGVMWPLIIVSHTLNTGYKSALLQADGQMQAQIKRYELIRQANENLRRFKHDFDHLTVGISRFLKSSDTKGALRFLEDWHTPPYGAYLLYETGNEIADALLSDKQNTAQAHNIQINFDGLIPPKGISPMDICIILGNALDNALEACRQLPADESKTVSVSSHISNGFLFLFLTNPVKENVPVFGNTLPTTKSDKENHGIGLLSIQNAIKPYAGDLSLSCENRIFTAKIVLDLNITG